MRRLLLGGYHLCLRGLAILGLPFLVILGHQTGLQALSGGGEAIWPNLILILGTSPLCLFFAMPQLLPRRVRQPDVRDLGPFLFVGLGFVGFAVMSLAQAAIQGLDLPTDTLELLEKGTGAIAILLGGAAGLLALTLCNQAFDHARLPNQPVERCSSQPLRPSTDELRALRHARMRGVSL